jgi:hypothetical protein
MQLPLTNATSSHYFHPHERDSHSISPTTTMNSGTIELFSQKLITFEFHFKVQRQILIFTMIVHYQIVGIIIMILGLVIK